MKVAVLGADEPIGARIIESFQLAEGPTVAAIARHSAHLARAARFAIDLRVADVFDVDSLARSFVGCSTAVHAMTVESADFKRSATIFCRAAAQSGARRLVYLSSADVHGLNPPVGTTEKSPLHVRHTLAHLNALVTAERQFITESRALGLTGIILRPGLVYGPRSPLFAQIVDELRHERAFLFNKGDGVCNCVGLDNLVTAVRFGLKAKVAAGTALLVTDQETVTWREFYHAVAHGLGLPARTIRYVPDLAEQATAPETTQGRFLSPHSPIATVSAAPDRSDMIERQQCSWKLPGVLAIKTLGLPNPVSFTESLRRSLAWWRFAQGDFSTAA